MTKREKVKCPNCQGIIFEVEKVISDNGMKFVVIFCKQCHKYHPLVEMIDKEITI